MRVEIADAGGLLGGHVTGGADERSGGGLAEVLGVGLHEFGDAEVDDLRGGRARAVEAEEQVGGLEVAVDDAEPVRRGEGVHHGREDAQHLVDGEALVGVGVDVGLETLAGEKLLNDVRHAGGPVDGEVEHVDHVGVADLRGRARLAQEPLHHARIPRPLRVQGLDGDAAVGVLVGGLEDLTHAAFAQ